MNAASLSDRTLTVQELRMPLPASATPDTATVVGPAKVCVVDDAGLALVVEFPDLYADPGPLLADRLGRARQLVGGASCAVRSPATVDWEQAIGGLHSRWSGACRIRRWRDHQSVALAGQFFVLAVEPDGDLAVSTVPIHCDPAPRARWARQVHARLRLVQVAWPADCTMVYRVLLPAAAFRPDVPEAGTAVVAAAIESLLTVTQILPSPAMVADRAFVRLLDLAAADFPLSSHK